MLDETVEAWLLATAIAAVLIGIGMFFSSRTYHRWWFCV
jgi:hypothetical protein